MASGWNESASDEIVNNKCSVCAEKNITKEAEKYCMECKDYYCMPCTGMHKMFPAMRRHTLLDKADFGLITQHASLPSFPTEVCSVHKGRLLEMYCKNHDEVACATCIALNHRTCQDIHSIPDEIETLYIQSESEETDRILASSKESMEGLTKTVVDLIRELENHKKKTIDFIIDYRHTLETELRKLEMESIKEVETECEKIEEKLRSKVKHTEKCTAGLDQSAHKLKNSLGNKAQEFVCVKAAQKDICEAKGEEESLQDLRKGTCVQIRYLLDPAFKATLEESKTFGQVLGVRKAYKPKTTIYAVKDHKEISIKLINERTCRCYGSCFTEDGLLLLTDYNNKQLKRIDLSAESIKDHVQFSDQPYGVCMTSDSEAAVCFKKAIQFVSLGKKIIVTKQLQLQHHCHGIAYCEGKLFISDDSSAVYIHDMAGAEIHKITTDNSGNAVFKQTQHISISSSRDKVYVADYHNGIITLDMEGNYKSTFTEPKLSRSRGICTDSRGNIFVNGSGDSKIVQISEEHNVKIGVLSEVTNTLSSCFDAKESKLIVTTFECNTVTVYDLE